MRKSKTQREQFRTIPGYTNYKISRQGTIINKTTGRTLARQYRPDKDHWSGRTALVSDKGSRRTMNIFNLVRLAFSIKTDATIVRYLAQV